MAGKVEDGSEHIAIFLPSLNLGGAERVMVSLANYFACHGKKVDCVLVDAAGELLAELAPTVNLYDLCSKRTSSSLCKFRNYLKRVKPQVVISTLNSANVFLVIAKLTTNVSTKFFIREASTTSVHLSQNNNLKTLLLRLLVKIFYPFSDHIIAVSEGVAEDLKNFISVAESKITIINNPIQKTHTNELLSKDVHKFFSEKSYPVILGAGRLEKPKNFPLLIRAFYELLQKKDCRLIIIGEGSERPNLEKLIKSFGIESYVSLPGYTENPFKYMSRADLFVLSSNWEGFPNVLVEAMSCGCPIVSTNCLSGPSEILENGRYGKLVAVNDNQALAEAMCLALNEYVDADHLIARANEFSIKKIANSYLDLFNNVVRES